MGLFSEIVSFDKLLDILFLALVLDINNFLFLINLIIW